MSHFQAPWCGGWRAHYFHLSPSVHENTDVLSGHLVWQDLTVTKDTWSSAICVLLCGCAGQGTCLNVYEYVSGVHRQCPRPFARTISIKCGNVTTDIVRSEMGLTFWRPREMSIEQNKVWTESWVRLLSAEKSKCHLWQNFICKSRKFERAGLIWKTRALDAQEVVFKGP